MNFNANGKIPFRQALSLYPDFVRVLAKQKKLQTTTALWILGDAEERKDNKRPIGRLAISEEVRLYKANRRLAAEDNLPDLHREFQKRIGLAAPVGALLMWNKTAAWSKTWPNHKPCGRLVDRTTNPHMIAARNRGRARSRFPGVDPHSK